MIYYRITEILWIFFVVYWIAKARNNKRTVERQSQLTRIIAVISIYFGAILIYGQWFPLETLHYHILPKNDLTGILGDIVCAAGIAFAVWARVVLGRNWSGTVTFKEGHELIERGPYAIVRNPMYTGIIIGFLGSAIVSGTVNAFVAILFMTAGLIVKIHTEEKLLDRHFTEEYAAYKKRVKRLIPFIY
ncbi:MAG TPA: isoprenylcysteine carboxylmethyltransferase family protein [Candidatus Kapabacteria bacterium]|nr:isoprenylcysteine carboxylmethyltransferase family protein [Candidatus Kapabacteria bacterium]